MNEIEFYKEIQSDKLIDELEKIRQSTEYEKFTELFAIKCLKCNSQHTSLYINNESFGGSEYTGYCEDISIGVKCLSCGNAWTTDKGELEI